MNDSIELGSLRAIAGSSRLEADGLRVEPDGEGVFCLSLDRRACPARWAAERWLVLDMLADSDRMPVMYFDFIERAREGGDAPAEGRVLSVRYFMIPGRRVKMVLRLSELDSHRFFLPTYPGSYKGHVEGEPTSIERIDELRIRIKKGGLRGFTIFGLGLADELPDLRVTGESIVDELGQRKGFDWPGKMRDPGELVAYLRAELERARSGGGYPESWSRYGGWKLKRFDATGFFHLARDGRRWWLVDPEGYAFYSNGVCYACRMGEHGFVDRMEELFDWLPDRGDPRWKDCWTEASEIPEFAKRNGREAGKGRALFNFGRANMIRAFGPERWWEAWVEIAAARMRSWGVNTIGVGVNNYSDERLADFLARARIPYVVTVKDFPLTERRIYRDFPDVFSPEYAERSERFAREQLGPYLGDPLMIGYFITNEPEWLFQDSVNPAERVLASEGFLHSKEALIGFLRERYANEIGALNRAWGLSLAGFDALREPLAGADRLSEASRADLAAFRDLLIAKYASVPSEALRRVDPEHLNLGMRYNRLTPNEFAGNAAFDICSFNCYKPDPSAMLAIAAEKDRARPALIGEWHVAGSEPRNAATGLVYSPSQEERAKACLFYMERAMASANCVGAHYFEWNDQPVLGRFDGECMQHGLVSVCNRPYPELSEAMASLARRMYDIVDGGRPPTEARGETVGNYS